MSLETFHGLANAFAIAMVWSAVILSFYTLALYDLQQNISVLAPVAAGFVLIALLFVFVVFASLRAAAYAGLSVEE